MIMKTETVLTNGVVALKMHANKYDFSVELGDHILAQDKYGNYYIDGILANIEVRVVSKKDYWD